MRSHSFHTPTRSSPWPPGGGDTVHWLFALVLPLVLVPTALFGAAFPVLIRLYSRGAADAGRAIGVATAVNIAGSIAASLIVTFWCIPQLGMDASLYALVLLDLAAALAVLAHSEAGRAPALAGAGTVVVAVALAFGGVRVDQAIAGREIDAASLAEYRAELARRAATQTFVAEGRASIVTVYDRPGSRLLRSNGLPEADFQYSPPYFPLSSVLLGIAPELLAEAPTARPRDRSGRRQYAARAARYASCRRSTWSSSSRGSSRPRPRSIAGARTRSRIRACG